MANYTAVEAYTATDAPDALKKILWSQDLEETAATEDIFADLEGDEKAGKPVAVKNDAEKGAGEKVRFQLISELQGAGTRSNGPIGNEEDTTLGYTEVELDWLTHATALDKRVKGKLGMFNELDNKHRALLGRWLGRKKQEDAMMRLRHGGLEYSRNQIRPNRKGSREALRTADTLDYQTIMAAGEVARPNGAKHAMLGRDKHGKPIKRFVVVGPNVGMFSLKSSGEYMLAVQNAADRGADNPLFAGGYVDVDGHLIRPFIPVDHDSLFGPVGCPIQPKAYLGTAIAAADTAINITGGGQTSPLTTPNYFHHFSNAAYNFGPDSITAVTDVDRYALIYNLSGADAGKWGFYKFRINTGNLLTMTAADARLCAPADAGSVRKATIGNVTWSDALNTVAHPSGSLIIETNSYGVPFGYTYFLGAAALLRAYGKEKANRTEESQNYGFVTGLGIESCYGQKPAKRVRDDFYPNFLLIEHSLSYPQLNLPVIDS